MTDDGRTKAEQMLAELRTQDLGGTLLARELEEAVVLSSDADEIPVVAYRWDDGSLCIAICLGQEPEDHLFFTRPWPESASRRPMHRSPLPARDVQ